MLECQKETEHEKIIICKKLVERTGFEDYKINLQTCDNCQKSSDKEEFLKKQEVIFYMSALMQKQREEYLPKAKDFFIKNKDLPITDQFIYNNLSSNFNRVIVREQEIDMFNYYINNIKDLNIEKFNKFIEDKNEQYRLFKEKIIVNLESNQEQIENTIKQVLPILMYRNDFVKRLIKEEKDKFSEYFLNTIDKCFEEQDLNIKKIAEDLNFIPVIKVSLIDKIKGAKATFDRIKNSYLKSGKEPLWIDEKEIIERQVCCTTCSDGASCPYCGCGIKKSWFLPLGKTELTTEGCPNSNTYSHLKRLPPKNYWEVCNEKTSIIISAKNEKYLNRTINSLIENATGDIEILVGLDGCKYDIIENEIVTVLQYNKHIGRRKISNQLVKLSTGKYLFEVDAHCSITYGWDTKLKCVCDDNTIVGCSVNALNEESWEGNDERWIGGKVVDDVRWEWDKINEEVQKIEKVESFNACGWMIRRDSFDALNGHDEELGEWGWENVEWTLKNKRNDGNIIIRTDVVVSHLFRKDYPYEIKGKQYKDVVSIIKNKDYRE